MNPLGRNNIAQKDHLRSEEMTLLKVSIKLLFGQNGEHLMEMLSMILLTSAIDEYIIKIDNNKSVNHRFEYLVHQSHEGARGISQAKGHD